MSAPELTKDLQEQEQELQRSTRYRHRSPAPAAGLLAEPGSKEGHSVNSIVRLACPVCHRKLRVSEEHLGRPFCCPCGRRLSSPIAVSGSGAQGPCRVGREAATEPRRDVADRNPSPKRADRSAGNLGDHVGRTSLPAVGRFLDHFAIPAALAALLAVGGAVVFCAVQQIPFVIETALSGAEMAAVPAAVIGFLLGMTFEPAQLWGVGWQSIVGGILLGAIAGAIGRLAAAISLQFGGDFVVFAIALACLYQLPVLLYAMGKVWKH